MYNGGIRFDKEKTLRLFPGVEKTPGSIPQNRKHACAGNAGSGKVSSPPRSRPCPVVQRINGRPFRKNGILFLFPHRPGKPGTLKTIMEIDHLLPITTRQELREWLEQNHRSSSCCWVPVTRKPSPHAILYLDAVEEALCFGWIDSTRKKTASGLLAQRLTPRSRKSKWSELNKERVRRLDRLGLMTPHGKNCLPEMDPEAFRMDPVILEALQQDPRAYANFLAFPRLYRHVRLDTIQIKKNQPELFHSRLEKFLKNTRENRMYGEWNDEERLLEE